MAANLINLEEVQASVQSIDKKIILVDSSKYTDEAFEYLLDIIDESKIIAFIVNERKIYTHGEYFGGDLWEDTLNYFSKYAILDENNKIKDQFFANSPKEAIELKGEGGVVIYNDYDIDRDANIIHIQYDLNAAIDESSYINIGDKFIKLTKHDNKLALDYHDATNITLVKPPLIEYDSGSVATTIPVIVERGESLTKLEISADENGLPIFNTETGSISLLVVNNAVTTVTVVYGDDLITKEVSVVQEWGYAYAYGILGIIEDNFDSFKSDEIEKEFHEKTIELDIPENKYGWFAYPADTAIRFIDVDSDLAGGWTKSHVLYRYDRNIKYQVYRTEQTGLGKTKWKITEK